jgi:hypothetical protein
MGKTLVAGLLINTCYVTSRFLLRKNPGADRSYTGGGKPKLGSGNTPCGSRMDRGAEVVGKHQ